MHNISITLAREHDIARLTRIVENAMSFDQLTLFVHCGRVSFEREPPKGSMWHHLANAIASPTHMVLAAAYSSRTEGDEIVGVAVWQLHNVGEEGIKLPHDIDEDEDSEGSPGGSDVNKSSYERPSSERRRNLARRGQAEAQRIQKRIMRRPHYELSLLCVSPTYQHGGVGSALLQHGFTNIVGDQYPVWVRTHMHALRFYRRFGFEDVAAVDIDLTDVMGRFTGFGVYRNVCLVREARGVGYKGEKEEINW